MPRRYTIIALAVVALIALVIFAARRGAGPDHPSPAVARESTPAEPEKPEKIPVDEAVTKSGAVIRDMGLAPGEVVPGTRPDTIVVQPMGPGLPKEIYRTYRVPTPDEDPRIDRLDDGRLVFNDAVAMARLLHAPDRPPVEDLDLLEGILGYYRMVYKQNPVAEDNTAVIRALTGKNPQNVVVFPDDHPDLNANLELADRWGTPYYFHALSRDNMDIWSAGPDTKFGTIDDLRLGAEDPALQLEGDSD